MTKAQVSDLQAKWKRQAVQGQEFYSTLAADVANVLCTGYAWKLLAALPEP